MFRFAHPEYLYLLLAAPALVALFAWALYDRRRRLARFGDPATVATLMPDASTGRMKLKFILFTTAVILVILAAARPQFGSKLREQKSEGIEMMLAVDISNSMLAEDFEPNRHFLAIGSCFFPKSICFFLIISHSKNAVA